MALLTHIFHNTAHHADFTLRVVGPGDRYGHKMHQTHAEDDPLVEFYDRRWNSEVDPEGMVLGQFVARDRLSVLLKADAAGRTAFDTDIILDATSAWQVDAESMNDCFEALCAEGIVKI